MHIVGKYARDDIATGEDVMVQVRRALPLSEKEWIEAEHQELERRRGIYLREAQAVAALLVDAPLSEQTERQTLVNHLDAVYNGLFRDFVQGRKTEWRMDLPDVMFSPHPLRGK